MGPTRPMTIERRTRRVTVDELAALSNDELVTMILGGVDVAFDEMHRRHVRAVTTVVRSGLRSNGDVADVVQDVFVSAWNALPTLREPAALRGWLLQIARRAVIDYVRRGNCRPPLANDDDLLLGDAIDRNSDPHDAFEVAEVADRLHDQMTRLSARDATVISLAVHFGFGPAEIAEALKITPNNAKVVLHRARQRLRAALD